MAEPCLNSNHSGDQEPPVALSRWLRAHSLSRTTGYRYRKYGWLKTEIRAGRPYVSKKQSDEFDRRMAAGEFAVVPKTKSKDSKK